MTLFILIIILLSVLAVPLSLKKLIDQSKKTGKEDVLPGFDMSGEDEHRVVLESRAGYGIEVDEEVPDGAEKIVIALHGFSGSKESKAIVILQRIVTGRGVGLVKFDWPAHGRSRAKGSDLTVTNCLRDLETVVQHVRRRHPDVELATFATSFGGYLAMLYAAKNPKVFSQIVLRSPALRFGWLLREKIIDEDLQRQLNENGYFETGFDRMIRVYQELIDESGEYRIEDIYGGFDEVQDEADAGITRGDGAGTGIDVDGQYDPRQEVLSRTTIIHGDADELVPYEDSVAFAKAHDIELYTVQGADHRYTGEGMLEEAVAFAAGKISRRED